MNKTKNIYRGTVGIIVLAALLLSLFDQLTTNSIPTIGGRLLGYISYFTELSNIMVTMWYFNKVFFKERIAILNKDSVRGAITLYICVAGLIFFLILNQDWHAHGRVKLEEYTLHGFSPIAFILDYLLFERKGIYKFKNALLWLIFPIVYLFYALAIGKAIDSYPYPFLNMNVITVMELIHNLIFILIPAFLVLGFLIVSIDKLLAIFKLNRSSERIEA